MHIKISKRSICVFLIFVIISIAYRAYIIESFSHNSSFTDYGSLASENSVYNKVYVPDNISSINTALSMVSPGGTIYLKKGVYNEYVRINKSVRIIGIGEVIITNRIIISSTKNVSIHNVSISIFPPGSEEALIIYNSSNIKLFNISFIYSGIIITRSQNILIINSNFEKVSFPSIIIKNKSHNITIEYNVFNNVYTALTVFDGSNIIFSFNKIFQTRSYGVKLLSKSMNVKVYLNNFYDDVKCYDEGRNNLWYDPITKLGNYWEHTTKTIEHNLNNQTCNYYIRIDGSANNIDKYPLCSSYENYISIFKNTHDHRFENTSITGTSVPSTRSDRPTYILTALPICILILVLLILIYYRRRKRNE